jgi:hypothetical protein
LKGVFRIDKELIDKSIQIAKENKENFSTQLLHRKLIQSGFKVGNIRCNRLIDELEQMKMIEVDESIFPVKIYVLI